MTSLFWILLFGLLMGIVSTVGALTLLLPEPWIKALLKPAVALSAGSLIGGALFHMIPASLAAMPRVDVVLYWVAGGFVLFFVLEQFLHWHHCHNPPSEHHAPLTWLLLIADGVHNLLGGLAMGGAFLIDFRLGLITFLAEVAHEIPQELGDFGVMLHGGWSAKKAILYNFISALTFPLGGVLAWALASDVDVSFLLPFGAGNFLYIAAADLIPEVKKEGHAKKAVLHFVAFVAGLALLILIGFLPHSHGGHSHAGHAHGGHDHGEEAAPHDHAGHDHGEEAAPHDHAGHDHGEEAAPHDHAGHDHE